MTFTDIIKDSILNGFTNNDIPTTKILLTLLVAYLIAMYIYLVYRYVTKNEFYQKSFGISMAIMSVITAGILMAMQSSLVISLGMVGALSIVRFRTAIKDPMDLLFLFWSIGIGIICGAGLFELALLTSLMATVGILVFEYIPIKRNSFILSINSTALNQEEEIIDILKQTTKSFNIKSKNINKNGVDYIFEIFLKTDDQQLVENLLNLSFVENVSLLENNLNLK